MNNEHDWRDDGVDTHKGEYWYICDKSGIVTGKQIGRAHV